MGLSEWYLLFRESLVLLDLRNGLAEDIAIHKGETVFTQPLDYVGIPFDAIVVTIMDIC